MTDPTSVLVCGDWHGDARWAQTCFKAAFDQGANCLIVVGDFGYWEHMNGGEEFLDACSRIATDNNLPLYWVDGNHENHTLLRARYGPGGDRHWPTVDGFWQIRANVYYIPRGTRWQWSGVRMMGLGGAYSVDKSYRLHTTATAVRKAMTKNDYRVQAGAAPRPIDLADYQTWWPEEELTDDEVAAALADTEPIDVLFTHDKPYASNPSWNRKDIDECRPNQQKIQTVVNTLHPEVLVHGHLHFRYTDYVRNGDDQRYTRVEGLQCNMDARSNDDRDPASGWLLLDLRGVNCLDDAEDIVEEH